MIWIVATLSAGLGWPALELLVFWLRFHESPPGGAGAALVFAPMGLVSGLVLAALLARSASGRQRGFVAVGYAVASPFAFLATLVSGLLLANALSPLVFGAPLLALGSWLGFELGRRKKGATA